jgi:radical SAM-linked protein
MGIMLQMTKDRRQQEVSNETSLSAMGWLTPLVIKFRIGGSLRFLSHAETLKAFQRACVRADIPIRYSQGFNPHPKMSLPLPRPVGVESDDELLCLQCTPIDDQSDLCDLVKARLSEQLPEGIELLSVSTAGPNTSFQPNSATYIIMVLPEELNGIKARIERLLAQKTLFVTRACGHSSRGAPGKVKEVDVRAFLKSIKLDNNSIIVQYEISPAGSIRADEILQLLEIEPGMLAAPIKRTNVQWK